MTNYEIEKDADECWALWRRKAQEIGVDVSKFPKMEVWHHAYRCGMALGKELEQVELESIFQGMANNEADQNWSDAFQQCAFIVGERLASE